MAGELRWDKSREIQALAAEIAAQVITGFGWLDSVLDFGDPTLGLPVNPADGDRYISTATANGWVENHIYTWNASTSTWEDYAPEVTDSVGVEADGRIYVFNGVDWIGVATSFMHNLLGGLQGGSVPLDEFYHLTQTQLADIQYKADKGQASGYCELDASAYVPDSRIPAGITRDTEVPDINARVAVRKNTGAVVGTRRRLNLIEGSNITLTVADDGAGEEVDITIASTGGGVGFNDAEGDPVDVDATAAADGTSAYAARRDHRHKLGAHASSHNAGGSDSLAADGAAGTATLRSLGTTGTTACAGNDARLSDARTPTAHSLAGSEHNADTLANLNAKINDADVVALAGQLGGTAASPDVRGLRETSGPTLLTMGAVADGEFLKRSGSNIVGATSAGGGLSHAEVMARIFMGF